MKKTELEKEREAGYELGFFDGVREQRRKDASLLIPETVEITVRVRGEGDQYEAIRRVLTFDLIGQSGGLILRREMEHVIAEVVTKTAVRDLIEQS